MMESVVTYVLMTFCGLALSIGAWFFKGLNLQIKTLTEAVSELRTEIAVMRRDTDTVIDLQVRVSGLQERIVVVETKLEASDG